MSTVTMQELELETAELLPARETLWYPSGCHPGTTIAAAATATCAATADQSPILSVSVLNGNLDGTRQRHPVAPARLAPLPAVHNPRGMRSRKGGPPGRAALPPAPAPGDAPSHT